MNAGEKQIKLKPPCPRRRGLYQHKEIYSAIDAPRTRQPVKVDTPQACIMQNKLRLQLVPRLAGHDLGRVALDRVDQVGQYVVERGAVEDSALDVQLFG